MQPVWQPFPLSNFIFGWSDNRVRPGFAVRYISISPCSLQFCESAHTGMGLAKHRGSTTKKLIKLRKTQPLSFPTVQMLASTIASMSIFRTHTYEIAAVLEMWQRNTILLPKHVEVKLNGRVISLHCQLPPFFDLLVFSCSHIDLYLETTYGDLEFPQIGCSWFTKRLKN